MRMHAAGSAAGGEVLIQKIYLAIGLILAIAFLVSSGAGKVKTRNDGSGFSTAVLIFILWPVCIIFVLCTFILDGISNRK